ncbi:MAG: cation:proton antiporter, partial [Actinomycetota bacterium]|nr:cation:proton antiporter [Actinomycetota bacterium]
MIGWLGSSGLVADLGAIGILYLMFLAGVSFNLRAFFQNRNSAITYGLLGFIIPFSLTIWVSVSFLEFGLLAAALIGAMWASNTLLAYPDVRAAGLQNNSAVSAAVSAGVVADLLSLTVLAITTATVVIDADTSTTAEATVSNPSMPVWLAIPVLMAFTLWLLPKVTEWFFVEIGRTRMQRFVFVLAGMAAGASIALLGGIEGLIGAFLAGLGMNRLIPGKGKLMHEIDFVGSAIFIPAFMVSIGLSINPALLFDIDTLMLALLFTVFVVVGKSAAAIITGRIFKFSWNEVGLMASLSFGQAASTLAIAQVGVGLGLFGQEVVNAAVLAIVTTALITSYGTRLFIRMVPRPIPPPAVLGETVLVDVRANGSDLETLMTLAGCIARPDDGLVIPYAVPGPGQKDLAATRVDEATETAAALGLDTDGVVRVDESFADGTLNLIEEDEASLILLSWAGPRFPADYVFGNDIDGVGERSTIPTMAARVLRPWNRVIVTLGSTGTAWKREDALLALAAVRRIRRTRQVPLVVVTSDRDLIEDKLGVMEDVEIIIRSKSRGEVLDMIEPDDLVVAPAYLIHDAAPVSTWKVSKSLSNANLAVIAGPHRLSISKGVTRYNIQSVAHPGL